MSNCIYNPMKGLYLGQSIQEWTKLNLWKTAFKKYSVICPALADHIGQISYRLSSTNLTWSILEYFAPISSYLLNCIKLNSALFGKLDYKKPLFICILIISLNSF